MQGIKTKTVYKTWVDPKYNNWKNWLHILEVANTKGVVISNIKLKDVDKKIVNADSEPRLEYVVTPEALANILEEYWDKQNTYKRMFGE